MITVGNKVFEKMDVKRGLIRHFENFFKAMKPALIDDKKAFVWISGLNHPLYNLITHFSLHKEDVEEWFSQIVKKIPPNTPHTAWVHPENRAEDIKNILLKHGYTFLATCPVMTWQVETTPQFSYDIRKADDMNDFYRILTVTSHYDQALGKGVADLLCNTKAEHYLGYLDDHPVGIVTLFLDGENGRGFQFGHA